MPNENSTVNEVIVNGKVVMSTREDTVSQQTLVQGKTATNSAGEKIQGELDPVTHNEAYLVNDPVGTIDDNDYIPFNDISDYTQPKKKTHLTSFVMKLMGKFTNRFYNISSETTSEETASIIQTSDDLNTYIYSGTYFCDTAQIATSLSNCPVNVAFKLLVDKASATRQTITITDKTDGGIWTRQRIYANDTYTWEDWQQLAYKSDVSGDRAHSYDLGASIPDNADLDDYTTAGNYRITSDGSAATIAHLPLALCGKILVYDNGNTGLEQFYYPNHSPRLFMRTKFGTAAWTQWAEFSSASSNKVHTYETGTAIPAQADLDTYTTEGVYTTSSNNNTATLSNCPTSYMSKILVMRFQDGNTSYYMQWCIPYNENAYFIRNTQDGATTWSNWKKVSTGAHTYELGTEIPANSDLNTYTTIGVYQCELTTTARTMSNLPYTGDDRFAFKLIVMADRKNANLVQWYIPYATNTDEGTKLAWRTTDDGGTTWNAWSYMARTTDITPSAIGNGYSIASVNGSAITATIDGFQLRAGVIVVLNTTMPQNATLNINNTGSKSVTWWGTNTLREKDLPTNRNLIFTLMYDGTYYRIISYNASAMVFTNGNYVADTAGNVCLEAGIEANALQFKYDVANDLLKWNRYKNSTWLGDKTIASLDDITPSTVGDGYAEASVSGSTITATISQFQLKVGAIVAIKIGVEITTACTLNINSTGAKSVKFWNNEDPSYGKPIGVGCVNTFIYDGTYYRLISLDRTPHVRVQDYVTDGGSIALDWGYSVNRTQIKYDIGKNKLVWNGYKNSAWKGNAYLADYYDIVHQTLGTSIPVNSDFDNYTTNGIYNVASNANSATMSNIPVARAGKLVVMRVAGNNYVTQLYLTYNETNYNDGLYRRAYNGDSGSQSWTSWVRFSNDNDIGASVAKIGKSILHPWTYTSNVYTANGVTFTFNPLTCEINVNGTATADAYCFMAKAGEEHYSVTKGKYIISGCPSGGSDTTYKLFFQIVLDGSTSISTFNDFGSGCVVNLDRDGSSQFDTNNTPASWGIVVRSGQTISNKVFKPMLRPAFASSSFEPVEDIHKGNCYVGTCTTAAGTKDKVAYVDGYFILRKGVRVAIRFTYSNTYSNTTSSPITLNVNNTGAKNIFYGTNTSATGNTGTSTTIYGEAGRYHYYVYDGTNWIFDGRSQDNDGNNRKAFYGKCSTAADQSAKVVSISDTSGWELRAGVIIGVKSTNTNTASNVTLNVNNTGAKSIYYNTSVYTGNANSICGAANATRYYMYDGTYWVYIAQGITNSDTYTSAYCSTAADQAAKVASCNGYQLLAKSQLHIIMTNTNTKKDALTLNVNGKGAKPIFINGSASSASNYTLPAGSYLVYYNGTNYYFRTDGKITCAGTVTV